MGLKLFISGANSHTGRIPMVVSSGLKRSQRASKCHQALGAEHTRASHTVSQRHETLGTDRIRVLHAVSECSGTLCAERLCAFH